MSMTLLSFDWVLKIFVLITFQKLYFFESQIIMFQNKFLIICVIEN